MDKSPEPWKLLSPISVVGLRIGDLVLDVTVVHGLRAWGNPSKSDLPRVDRIDRIERIDGQPIGTNDRLQLDLVRLAVDGVLMAIRQGEFLVRVDTGDPSDLMYGSPTKENWREIAHAIRFAAVRYGARMKWTDEMDRRLVELWAHITEHGCGTAEDLSHALGTTSGRVHKRLYDLRSQGVDVPSGRQGRPPKKKENQ
jgi:hypothetical protein